MQARQARSGHRGHVSAAAHSLEAGSSLPEQKSAPSAQWAPGTCVGGGAFPRSREQFTGAKKRAKRAVGTGDMCRRRRILSKPGAVSSSTKKMSRRVTLADSFFLRQVTASGFEGTRRFRHVSSVPNARLARFFSKSITHALDPPHAHASSTNKHTSTATAAKDSTYPRVRRALNRLRRG